VPLGKKKARTAKGASYFFISSLAHKAGMPLADNAMPKYQGGFLYDY
jgi:hypothetical protein